MQRLGRLAAALAFGLAGLGPAGAAAMRDGGPPGLRLATAGPVETVFDWSKDACAPSHVPDSSARAFRDAAGAVHLIASHNDNRLFSGPDLDHVRPDCAVVHEAARNADLARYDDLDWISGVWTRDGATVYALVHSELRGERTPGLCPAGKYSPCLFNTVTALVSHDGGRTFDRPPGDAGPVVMALPYPFPTDRRSRVGYANPSNIIEKDGFLYAFVFADSYRAQKRGPCLIRTATPDDPSSWRGYDGKDFAVRFVDPFASVPAEPEAHVCAPVAPGTLGRMIGSVTLHRPSGLYVAAFGDERPVGGRPRSGIFAATSPDLIHWSAPALVFEAPLLWQGGCGGPAPVFYPSLLDDDARTRSFEDMDDTAFLYLARFNLDRCRITWDRDLIRVPVRVTGPDGS